jgi:hypothetical protein
MKEWRGSMAQMIRKQVYIEPRQERTLKRLAREQHATEAEVIRRAIDLAADTQRPQVPWPDPEAWEEAKAFILSLISRGHVPGGRSWKREELYEERIGRYGR